MKRLLSIVTAGMLASLTLATEASSLEYDYLDIALVESEFSDDGPEHDGYNANFGFSLGSHFYLKLGFDNVSAKETNALESIETRTKVKRFGFGYRNDLTNSIDFVAEYTQDDYHSRYRLMDATSDTRSTMEFHGDTTQVGLRGELTSQFEWESFVKRKTHNLNDFDETGYSLGIRYRVVPQLSIGVNFESIGDFQQTGVGFRYNY